MPIVCWGEVLWDLFPDQARLGGAPANVAYHLARVGGGVALVSRVGDDEPGRRARVELAAAGVDVSAVQIDPARPTGAVEVAIDGGEATYRLRRGCAWESIELDGPARAAMADARAVCFGTLSQRQAPAREALAGALAARAAGCLAVCDLNLRRGEQDVDLVRWALGAAQLVKINDREAAELGALFARRDVLGWMFGELGVELVALTHGPDGCELMTSAGERVRQAGFAAEPGGDNVGCGDAFTAVLVHQLLAGAPLDHAAACACRYAAFVASRRGATPPVPPEVVAAARAPWV